MATSITPSIYKIDLNKVKEFADDRRLAPTNAHAIIKVQHEKRKELLESTAKSYNLVITNSRVGEYEVAVYKTASGAHPHPWAELFDETITGLEVKYPNLAAFFAKGDECYAISSGMGYTFFEQFIDTSFPLAVARHIMSPYLSATTERDIAGAVYGRDQQFRTSQLVVSSQNLGTVWQAIRGEITEEIKQRRDFSEIYVVNKGKIAVSAGTSLKVHKAIEIKKLADLLVWIEKILQEDIPQEQKAAFEFLDGLTELNSRKEALKIEAIKTSMGEVLYEDIVNNHQIDFDFSHKNFVVYQSAAKYHFASQLHLGEWSHPPTASEVFDAMKSGNLITAVDGSTLIEELSKISFFATHEDSDLNDLHANIIDYLHGEIEHGGVNYFLIDGKMYLAKSNFIDRVKVDFDKLLRSQYFAEEPNLRFDNYVDANFEKEGDYNDSYKTKEDWLEADRVFWDNVEIADLFYRKNEKLYIIHNKLGFGVTVRDVCSQVLHSMNIVNRMRDSSNETEASEYYKKIMAKHYPESTPPISREEFINKILKTKSSDIVYVIGYASKSPVTNASRSNIAKFEAVKLCNTDRRVFDFALKVLHIPRV